MKIQLSDHVALKLMTIANIIEGLEFSGFGFVEISGVGHGVFTILELRVGRGRDHLIHLTGEVSAVAHVQAALTDHQHAVLGAVGVVEHRRAPIE